MHKLVGLLICICFGFAFSATYRWNNGAGGSWSIASNWSPNGVPGSGDDVVIESMDSTVQNALITLSGSSVTVNSLSMDQQDYSYSFMLGTGAITVSNTFYFTGGSLYRINVTLNGASTISCGRDDDVCNCDSCKVKVASRLTFTYDFFSGFRKANNAEFTNLEGATTTIKYSSVYNEGNSIAAKGTFINYGTLIFEATQLASPSTPYGDAQVATTGTWKELINYGTVEITTPAYEVGIPLYSDVVHWAHLEGGQMTIRIFQPSTLTYSLFWNSDYEYNDQIATASRSSYTCTLGGNVHVVFGSIDVAPGNEDRPFTPQIGNFFPIFPNNLCDGKFNAITWEGLPNGMSLGPIVNASYENDLIHYGVVICASTDTDCIEGTGIIETPLPAPGTPNNNAPQAETTAPDGTIITTPSGSNPNSPSGSNPSNSPSGSTNPNTPSSTTPSTNIKVSSAVSLATSVSFIVMTVVSLIML